MPENSFKLGTPFTMKPLEFRQITLGVFGPGEPPAFSVTYQGVTPEGAVSLWQERVDVGKGRYELVYMFQSYARTSAEIVITDEDPEASQLTGTARSD